jgi:hypothetical protein
VVVVVDGGVGVAVEEDSVIWTPLHFDIVNQPTGPIPFSLLHSLFSVPTVTPLFSLHEERRLPIRFAFPAELGTPEPSPDVLCQFFFPDSFIDNVAETTRLYANAKMNGRDRLRKEVASSDILRFFSAIVYMGVVKLDNRKHYFHPPLAFPPHPFLDGLPYDRFAFIWYEYPFPPT